MIFEVEIRRYTRNKIRKALNGCILSPTIKLKAMNEKKDYYLHFLIP